jgi:glyoxylase-like metal-dependent hydrolase (beta-lactamase superfamily II)
VFVGDEASYNVTSTLIYGETEGFVVDSEFHLSQARKWAEQIAAHKVHLKAIFITHPDEDHYFGMAALHERFPETPIYMTATALDEYQRTMPKFLEGFKKRLPAETPDALPTPEVLPTTKFQVDGRTIEIVPDLQGDYPDKPANSVVWIPSLEMVIAGDMTFNGVHPWLGGSTETGRAAWSAGLDRIAALHPRRIVSGHKRTAALQDTPDVVAFMKQYVADFGAARKTATSADELEKAMVQKYPELGQQILLSYSSKMAFAK